MKLLEMLPRSQPWDIFFYHVKILVRLVEHVRATESSRQEKHIYHKKESTAKSLKTKNEKGKKIFGKNMLEMVGEIVGKEKWNESRWSGKKFSLLSRKRWIGHKTWPQGAAPLLQDHWACLQHPESFLISVHAQPFSSSTINLLMLF